MERGLRLRIGNNPLDIEGENPKTVKSVGAECAGKWLPATIPKMVTTPQVLSQILVTNSLSCSGSLKEDGGGGDTHTRICADQKGGGLCTLKGEGEWGGGG